MVDYKRGLRSIVKDNKRLGAYATGEIQMVLTGDVEDGRVGFRRQRVLGSRVLLDKKLEMSMGYLNRDVL